METVFMWVASFVFAVLIDVVYTLWIKAVADHKRVAASVWSALCPLLGFLSLLVCLDAYSAILPAAVGHALGTWIAMGKGKKDGTRIPA